MSEENNIDNTSNAPDVSALEERLNKAEERARRFEGLATDYEKRYKDVNLDQLKADAEAFHNLKKETVSKSGNQEDIDALLKEREERLRTEHQSIIDELKKEKDSLSSNLREVQIVDKAFTKLASKFNDDTHEFIKDIIRSNVDVDDSGNFYVKDKDGKPRYVTGSANQIMGLEQFESELMEKYPSLAKSNVSNGTRRNGSSYSGGSLNAESFAALPAADRMRVPLEDRHKLAKEAVSKKLQFNPN